MDIDQVLRELYFRTTRSSGPGGQHVNKVSSRVSAFFDIKSSNALTEDERELILKKLQSKISKEGSISLHCEESRSQHKNKEIVIKKMIVLLKSALVVLKKRKSTKPSKASVQKRLDAKRKTSLKKILRKKIDD